MVDFDALVLDPCNAAFGETVYFYAATSGPLAVTGIFNERYQETKLQDGIEVVGVRPVLGIRAGQFGLQPVQGNLFRIRGILYAVVDPPEADGLGDLKIVLRPASDAEIARLALPAQA